MSVTTLGWGIWWAAIFWHRTWPHHPPPWMAVYTATCCLSGLGMFYAFFTLRARKSWIYMATMAWMANLGLFLVPWLVHSDLMIFLSKSS